jgi:CRISPR system Cascade subunit CasE
LREADEGYLCHCISRQIWQDRAPAPFVLRERGRTIELWGYSLAAADVLTEHAQVHGDPELVSTIAAADSIASKPMPRFPAGRRVGFRVRACPIVRLAAARHGHTKGAEVDAFLARCFGANGMAVSREQVYVDWLTAQINRDSTGARLSRARVVGMARQRLFRRTQGGERRGKGLERPDVSFEGEFTVTDSDQFQAWLGHGIGRHRAFGFGALMLRPPSSSHASF